MIELDAFGRMFHTVLIDEIPHRTCYEPGRWDDGVWVPTDVSQKEPEVIAASAEVWTPEVVEAFKASFPWEPLLPPPLPPSAEEKLAAAGLSQDEFDSLVMAAIARQQG